MLEENLADGRLSQTGKTHHRHETRVRVSEVAKRCLAPFCKIFRWLDRGQQPKRDLIALAGSLPDSLQRVHIHKFLLQPEDKLPAFIACTDQRGTMGQHVSNLG